MCHKFRMKTLVLQGMIAVLSVRPVQCRTPLTIAGFVDINVTENGWSSAGVVPAIEMALEDVNAREDLLSEYYLRWHPVDSKVRIRNMILCFSHEA